MGNLKIKLPVIFFTGILISTCGQNKNHNSELNAISADGTAKSFFTGFNSVSQQYTNRICMVPEYAYDKVNDRVDPRYAVPYLYSSGKSLVDPNNTGKPISEITQPVSGEGIPDGARKIPENRLLFNPNAEGTTYFKRDASASEIMNFMSGGVDVNMDLSSGSVKGSVKVAIDSGKTSRSTNLTFITKLKANSVMIDPTSTSGNWILTQYGRIVKEGMKKIVGAEAQLAYLKQRCGTHYVSQVDFGATFLANMKAIALLESDLDLIQGRIEGNFSSMEIAGEACINDKSFTDKVKIELNLYQSGGNPSQFATVLSGNALNFNLTEEAKKEITLPIEQIKPAPIDSEKLPIMTSEVKNSYGNCLDEYAKCVNNSSDTNKVPTCTVNYAECSSKVRVESPAVCNSMGSSCLGIAAHLGNWAPDQRKAFTQSCRDAIGQCRIHLPSKFISYLNANQKCEGSNITKPDSINPVNGDETAAAALVSCNANSFGECYRTFKHIMNYATGAPISDFEKSVKDDSKNKPAKVINWDPQNNVWASQLMTENNEGYNIIDYQLQEFTKEDYWGAFICTDETLTSNFAGTEYCLKRQQALNEKTTIKSNAQPTAPERLADLTESPKSCKDFHKACKESAFTTDLKICDDLRDSCTKNEKICISKNNNCKETAKKVCELPDNVENCKNGLIAQQLVETQLSICSTQKDNCVQSAIEKAIEASIATRNQVKEISTATETTLKFIQQRVGDLFSVWGYLTDLNRLMPDFAQALRFSEIRNLVQSEIRALQQIFDTCHNKSPTECSAAADKFDKEYKDGKYAKVSDIVAAAEQHVKTVLATSGSFANYCAIAAASNFRAAPDSRWRITMGLSSNITGVAEDISIEYKLHGYDAEANSPNPENATKVNGEWIKKEKSRITQLMTHKGVNEEYIVGDEYTKYLKDPEAFLSNPVNKLNINLRKEAYKKASDQAIQNWCRKLAVAFELDSNSSLALKPIDGSAEDLYKTLILEPFIFHSTLTELYIELGKNSHIASHESFANLKSLRTLYIDGLLASNDNLPYYLQTLPLNQLTLVNPKIGKSLDGSPMLMELLANNRNLSNLTIDQKDLPFAVNLDLKPFVATYKKLYQNDPNNTSRAIKLKFAIGPSNIVDSDGISLGGIALDGFPNFFGYEVENQQCIDIVKRDFNNNMNVSVKRWISKNLVLDFSKVSIDEAIRSENSPCCQLVQQRCNKLKSESATMTGLKCGLTAGPDAFCYKDRTNN